METLSFKWHILKGLGVRAHGEGLIKVFHFKMKGFIRFWCSGGQGECLNRSLPFARFGVSAHMAAQTMPKSIFRGSNLYTWGPTCIFGVLLVPERSQPVLKQKKHVLELCRWEGRGD